MLRTSARPLMYPTASVIIGWTANIQAAAAATTSPRRPAGCLRSTSSAIDDRGAEAASESWASPSRSAKSSTTFNRCSRRLVRWNPNGAVPQMARSIANDRLTSGRDTSCSTMARRFHSVSSDRLSATVWKSSQTNGLCNAFRYASAAQSTGGQTRARRRPRLERAAPHGRRARPRLPERVHERTNLDLEHRNVSRRAAECRYHARLHAGCPPSARSEVRNGCGEAGACRQLTAPMAVLCSKVQAEAGMSIGAQLRASREARGLSIDAVAHTTRVQPRILAAIERDDVRAVPPRPFGRGFVKAYAREIGLDGDQTTRDYFAQFAPVVLTDATRSPERAASTRQRVATRLATRTRVARRAHRDRDRCRGEPAGGEG